MPNIMRLGICLKHCTSSKLVNFLDTASKFVIFGVQFERRKLDKKSNLHEN